MGEPRALGPSETQLDRIEQLLRELHRDFRTLRQQLAELTRQLAVVAGKPM